MVLSVFTNRKCLVLGTLSHNFCQAVRVTPLDFHRYCVKPALQLRQLIWDQLYKLDGEYRQYEERLNVT